MISTAVLAYIPSPPTNGISLGPVRLHVYGLLIACGIVAAVWLSQRRWEQIGGAQGTMANIALWGVPGGLIGARIYSLITSWQVDTAGHWYRGFEIWRGGLGIWGGVVGGIAGGALGARHYRLPVKPLLDCIAPAFALGQVIGRWGNYFNQELYGRPSGLPWAVKIDNPPGYAPHSTFQPTFLYESIWDLIVLVLVIWAERRFRIRRGYLVFAYASFYTFGRFWTEYLRIDNAHRWLGLRLNDWTSIVVFVAATAILLLRGRAGPGDDRASDPLPAPVGASSLTTGRGGEDADRTDPTDQTDQAGRPDRLEPTDQPQAAGPEDHPAGVDRPLG